MKNYLKLCQKHFNCIKLGDSLSKRKSIEIMSTKIRYINLSLGTAHTQNFINLSISLPDPHPTFK